MKIIYQNVKHFFTKEEEYFNPATFIVATALLLGFVGTSLYIMALSLSS